MSQEMTNLTIKILDRDIKIKCPQNKILELKESANYLDRKVREVLTHTPDKVLGIEKLTIIAALNITYELLALQKQKNIDGDSIKNHIVNLQKKVDEAISGDI
jgi:cell division protein ZapA